LHLPKANEYGESAVRGQAVHAWLEERHRGPVYKACTDQDVPPRAGDWSAGKWHVSGEQAFLGARMLASHAEICAFRRRDHITEVRLEPKLAFHDTAANVIVIAKPDMIYLEDGAWVWREVKSRMRLPRSTADLFRDFPQLALATVLLAENALGGNPIGMRVELELLAPEAGDVLLIDPANPAEVIRARKALYELAAPWHADQMAHARPGPHCRNCPVSRWCPDAQTGDAV
jgi:hypothetical protein